MVPRRYENGLLAHRGGKSCHVPLPVRCYGRVLCLSLRKISGRMFSTFLRKAFCVCNLSFTSRLSKVCVLNLFIAVHGEAFCEGSTHNLKVQEGWDVERVGDCGLLFERHMTVRKRRQREHGNRMKSFSCSILALFQTWAARSGLPLLVAGFDLPAGFHNLFAGAVKCGIRRHQIHLKQLDAVGVAFNICYTRFELSWQHGWSAVGDDLAGAGRNMPSLPLEAHTSSTGTEAALCRFSVDGCRWRMMVWEFKSLQLQKMWLHQAFLATPLLLELAGVFASAQSYI